MTAELLRAGESLGGEGVSVEGPANPFFVEFRIFRMFVCEEITSKCESGE